MTVHPARPEWNRTSRYCETPVRGRHHFQIETEIAGLNDTRAVVEFDVDDDAVSVGAVTILNRTFTPEGARAFLGQAEIDLLLDAGRDHWCDTGWREAEQAAADRWADDHRED